MRIITLVLFAAFIMTGCTAMQFNNRPQVVEAIGVTPQIGETVTAQVGSTILSQFRLWQKNGFRIPQGYSGSVGGAPVTVTPTDLLVQTAIKSKPAYCTERLTMRNLFGVPIKSTCFTDATADSRFETVMVPADSLWWSKALPEPLKFEAFEEHVPRPGSIKRELIYLGTSGKIIRLGYREYLDNFARPAFSEEVTYDLSDFPMDISFRTTQFEILNISGSSMVYRVLRPLQE